MLSTRLPFRIVALARTTGALSARSALTRNVIAPLSARAYATPAKPKKGSIGATSTRGRAPSTRTASTATTPKKKKAPKPKPVKTPEQIERAKARALRAKEKAAATKEKDRIAQLKTEALVPPRQSGDSAYILFIKAKHANDPSRAKSVGPQAFLREVAGEYKSLGASELESYTRQARESQSSAESAYASWVSGHSADEVRRANAARASLRRLGHAKFRAIKDPRALSRPATPFIVFATERRDPGDGLVEAARAAGREWKALGQSEKQKYVDSYEQAVAKYERDYQQLYGVAPPKRKGSA